MKFLISACLAGQPCRYNGSHCGDPYFQNMIQKGEALPFCPEVMGGLPTPREPAEIRRIEGVKRVFTRSGKEVTKPFQRGAASSGVLAEEEGAVCGILKSNSPSCGFGWIYDGAFQNRLVRGQGLAADVLSEKGLFLFHEKSFLGSIGITLKKVREEDFEGLVQISKEAFLQNSGAHSPLGPDGPEGYDSIVWYKEASSRGYLFTIRLKKTLVGGIFYTLKSDGSGWINRVFIKPDFQGQGIGRKAFFLLEQKYSRITEWGLDTPVWSKHNQDFYQSMGYRINRKVFSREAGFNLVVLKKKKPEGGGSRPV